MPTRQSQRCTLGTIASGCSESSTSGSHGNYSAKQGGLANPDCSYFTDPPSSRIAATASLCFRALCIFTPTQLIPMHAKNITTKSDRPGSRIKFAIEGRVLLLMDWHIRGPMGKAKVQVDDQPAVVRDAWFDQTWGGYRQTSELARNLPPAKSVAFEILSEKNPQSTGREYRILGLGAAGVASR